MEKYKYLIYWLVGVFLAIFLIAVSMVVFPIWGVWASKLSGEGALARAESSRRVIVAQARAEMEAAELRAKAIAIVGKAAKDFPEYRTQEFIGSFAHALDSGKISQIIYVPTEANIPITEAGRIIHTKK